MEILTELNKYLLWDYMLLVVLSGELVKKILPTLPSYKRLVKPQQRDVKTWLCFFSAGIIAIAYYRFMRGTYVEKSDFMAFQIKLLINFFSATTIYNMLLKSILKKINRSGDE
mgnify:CR=1 FL=1